MLQEVDAHLGRDPDRGRLSLRVTARDERGGADLQQKGRDVPPGNTEQARGGGLPGPGVPAAERPAGGGLRPYTALAAVVQAHQASGQPGAGRGLAEGVHPPLESPEGRGFLTAPAAPGQMTEHPVTLVAPEFPVDQGRKALARAGHSCCPAAAGAGRVDVQSRLRHAAPVRRGRRCSRDWRSCARPRWIRLRTVPSFTPRVSAISS